MQPEFAHIYRMCRDLLKAMEVASTLMLLRPDQADFIALEQLEPPTTALEGLLRTHQHELVRALGNTDSVRCFSFAGATAPDAILKFAKEFLRLGIFYPDASIRRKGMDPLRDGLEDARSRLLIEEARLGCDGLGESSHPPALNPTRLTRAEIASQLGVTEGRVRGWVRRKDDPLKESGKRGKQPLYDLDEARRILRGDLPPK